ncbi:hypothetical protein ACO0RG_002387 [Hanseniaspora osmophila]
MAQLSNDSRMRATCPFEKCASKIIAYQDDQVIELPSYFSELYKLMKSSESVNDATRILPTKFLVTQDIWDFDNIGVSKSLDTLDLEHKVQVLAEEGNAQYSFKNIVIPYKNTNYKIVKALKYLICADCDKGPLGVMLEVFPVGTLDNASHIQLNLLNVDVCKT